MESRLRPRQRSIYEQLAIGLSTAAASKTASAPVTRLKLLIQNQNELIRNGRLREPYKGALDCISRVYRTEGLRHFWKGNLVSCLGAIISQPVNYALKYKIGTIDAFRVTRSDSTTNRLIKNISSGFIAGALTLSFMYSIDYTHHRLATDVKVSGGGASHRQFKGLVDVYRQTLKKDGFVGLHRGFIVSCVGIVVYRGLYFGLYDFLRPIFLGSEINVLGSYAIGFGVTITAGLMSYPFDTVRRRMMLRSCEEVKYKGAIDCASQIMRNEGAMSFMKGAGISIVGGLWGASVLALLDVLKNFTLGVH